jgi:hypothetical protein
MNRSSPLILSGGYDPKNNMPRTYGKVRSQTSPLDKGQGRKEVR